MTTIFALYHCNEIPVNQALMNVHCRSLITLILDHQPNLYINSTIGMMSLGKHTNVQIGSNEGSEKNISLNHIVYTGCLTNYEILRDQLIGVGYSSRIQGESDLILRLYETLGSTFVSYLRGAFSFMIWDQQLKKLFSA